MGTRMQSSAPRTEGGAEEGKPWCFWGDQLWLNGPWQFIAGRCAQEYNARKKRNGAYWEDRYHATAVETGEHLLRCLVYIDLT